MIVMKFGGTSLGDAARVRRACGIVQHEAGREPLVVVSAHSGVTDDLIAAAHAALEGETEAPYRALRERHLALARDLEVGEAILRPNLERLRELLRGISLVKELTPRTLDFLMSFGERLSSKTIAATLRAAGVRAEAVNAYDLGLVTNSLFGRARELPETYQRIPKEVAARPAGTTLVTTGFVGKDARGDITTLGRSGSDYTASIFGEALHAEEIQIWTDVDGIMTADPSLVPGAKSIAKLSFEEASELAYYGAEVLHPATIVPAMRERVSVRVLNTFQPDSPGTVITPEEESGACAVKSVAYKENLFLVNVASPRMLMDHGFMARIFQVFERHNVVIDMIATSEVSLSMTTDSREGLDGAVREINEFAEVTVEPDQTIVCIVGGGMRGMAGTAARVFRGVAASGVSIRMISQGAREINIAFLVNDPDVEPVVRALHAEFFEDDQGECKL